VQEAEEELVGKVNPNNPDTRKSSDQTDVIDQLITEYTAQGTVSGSGGTFGGYDQTQNNMGDFNVQTKKQLNMNKMESPYSDDIYDSREFSYKNKNFIKQTPEDLNDLFDVKKMLPQEEHEDWFDIEPLASAKKIQGTHLIHPKIHMGVNTVMSSLRNATHDIRGDIPCPKIKVSPWLNSTIEPDTNLKGFCNSN